MKQAGSWNRLGGLGYNPGQAGTPESHCTPEAT